MGLDVSDVVDALGIERTSGAIVLSIFDSWDWEDEQGHLTALQAKLNAYFLFVESGQVYEGLSDNEKRKVVIDVIWRFAPSSSALRLIRSAELACKDLGIEIQHRHVPVAGDDS